MTLLGEEQSLSGPLRVVVADGDALHGHLVRFLLADDRIEVVGDTPPGDRASRLVQATQPDVVVVRPENGAEGMQR